MAINEQMLKDIIAEVMQEMAASGAAPTAPAAATACGVTLTPIGDAQVGKASDEVVIGLCPAFADSLTETITGVSHEVVLTEVLAGIEEEGVSARIIKVYKTADVGFVAHAAATLSGSGIGIGIQSKGTTVIHQRDLPPLSNLELFSQAPLLEADTFRIIGKNAAQYAKGLHPKPVPVRNDQMARPKYQAFAALLMLKESEKIDTSIPTTEMKVTFK
jgi:propanediol dehydratase medium subunit